MPNWTGGMASTSDDDDDDEQQAVPIRDNQLRKCLLCNIEVRKKIEKIVLIWFFVATSTKSSL